MPASRTVTIRNLATMEARYLQDAAEGLTIRRIAQRNYRSADTVSFVLCRARRKLRARSTTHAVALVIGRGEIQAPA